jgi:hypothetical protein
METTNNKPKLTVKAKNLQLVFDYCIENKLKFSVGPRLIQDEWEFELNISDIMAAVALGVFIKENKIEVAGLVYNPPKAQQAAVQTKVAAKPTKTIAKKGDLLEEASQIGLQVGSSEELIENDSDVVDDINPIITNSKSELAF